MSVSKDDKQLFDQVCHQVMERNCLQQGIGTLSEKTVHAVMKNFYEPNPDNQEVPIGNYIADIFQNGEIIEIQTRNLNAMRAKLSSFLDQYPVTIVHPIVHNKWLMWIDEETGEISTKRKSPKKGTRYDAFFELYKIKMFLDHPHLQICLPLIDVEEYRMLNGWSHDRKRGSTRYDRIPTALVDEIYLGSPADYICMLPDELPAAFTVKDYASATRLAPRYAGTAINVLRHLHVIEQIGKQGCAYVYQRVIDLPSPTE